MDPVEQVRDFLRAQNLEQLGRVDEAIELYERAVVGGFDSAGPYDRLIALYAHRAQHADVVRVVELALVHVHTYPDKKASYERIRADALKAQTDLPHAVPRPRE